MSKVQFGVVVALLSLLAGLQVLPIIAPDRTGPKWDYRIEAFPDTELVGKMNWLGDGGWEIVFARRAVGGPDDDRKPSYEMIFRRPR